MAKKNQQSSATSAESYGYKDSPLGRIPAEWEVKILKEVSYFYTFAVFGERRPRGYYLREKEGKIS